MQEILSIFTELAVIVMSYLLGCVCFAYYMSSIVHKKDIRTIGSGNPGSSNIGRQFGVLWFIPVLLLDALKGFLVVIFLNYFDFDTWVKLISMLAVIIGHIWPFQLSFNGGKGLATVMGVALGFNYFIVLGCAIIAGVFYMLISKSNAGLLVSVFFGPIFVWILGYSYEEIIVFMIIAAVVIFAHRNNILSFLNSGIKK
ncbi:MAG: glycerol-3-phosphate acyltransferase [SAR202 cluster bacterium]|nr:hypothetical protein [Chloroflexota bacterium]MQG38672.1 glycerol-3-phosphate acyltransferase [SAR202 cluster bacterium]|tara:strand:+ start:6034 stop:6630 length:597 start_codon:yes stop_codon:yes gene_type:complete